MPSHGEEIAEPSEHTGVPRSKETAPPPRIFAAIPAASRRVESSTRPVWTVPSQESAPIAQGCRPASGQLDPDGPASGDAGKPRESARRPPSDSAQSAWHDGRRRAVRLRAWGLEVSGVGL